MFQNIGVAYIYFSIFSVFLLQILTVAYIRVLLIFGRIRYMYKYGAYCNKHNGNSILINICNYHVYILVEDLRVTYIIKFVRLNYNFSYLLY